MALKTGAIKKDYRHQMADAGEKVYNTFHEEAKRQQKEAKDLFDQKDSRLYVPKNEEDDAGTRAFRTVNTGLLDANKKVYELEHDMGQIRNPKAVIGSNKHPIDRTKSTEMGEQRNQNPAVTNLQPSSAAPAQVQKEITETQEKELESEKKKVGQEAKTDKTMFQNNDDLLKKQYAMKYDWTPEETEEYFKARSDRNAEGSKEKMEELVGKSKKKEAEPYIAYFAEALQKRHPEWSHLDCVAAAQKRYEVNPKLKEIVRNHMKVNGKELPKETSYDENTREGKIARLSEDVPELSLDDAAEIIDKVWYSDPVEKVDMGKLGAYGSESPFAAKTEEEKEKEVMSLANKSVANGKLKDWHQKNYGPAIAATINIIGSAIRGGFGISNVILGTTQKMFNAFTSSHPMSAASQACVAAVSGVSELVNVMKDMNKTYGFTDPDNPYSKGLLMGTIKGAKYYKDREEAQNVAYDWLKQFNDEIDALGVADPTQLTDQQTRQIFDKMTEKYGHRLLELKQKDTNNKWNMQHGRPDAMTQKEKTELRLLSSIDAQIKGEVTLMNKIERAQKGPEFQAAYEALQQASGVAPLPSATVNNVASIEPDFEKESRYISQFQTELEDLRVKKKTTNSKQYDSKIDAMEEFVRVHDANKKQIIAARKERDMKQSAAMFADLFKGLSNNTPRNILELNEQEYYAVKNNYMKKYDQKFNMMDGKTLKSKDEANEYATMSLMKSQLEKCQKRIEYEKALPVKESNKNTYDSIISRNKTKPVDLGNGYFAYMNVDEKDMPMLIYQVIANNANSKNIDDIGIKQPIKIYENGKELPYVRPTTEDYRRYATDLHSYTEIMNTPEIKRRILNAGYSEDEYKHMIQKLAPIDAVTQRVNTNLEKAKHAKMDPILFPSEAYGIPDDPQKMMDPNWWIKNNTTPYQLFRELTERIDSLNRLKSQSPDSFDYEQQLFAFENARHNCTLYALKKELVKAGSRHQDSFARGDMDMHALILSKEIDKYLLKCGKGLTEKDTMIPDEKAFAEFLVNSAGTRFGIKIISPEKVVEREYQEKIFEDILNRTGNSDKIDMLNDKVNKTNNILGMILSCMTIPPDNNPPMKDIDVNVYGATSQYTESSKIMDDCFKTMSGRDKERIRLSFALENANLAYLNNGIDTTLCGEDFIDMLSEISMTFPIDKKQIENFIDYKKSDNSLIDSIKRNVRDASIILGIDQETTDKMLSEIDGYKNDGESLRSFTNGDKRGRISKLNNLFNSALSYAGTDADRIKTELLLVCEDAFEDHERTVEDINNRKDEMVDSIFINGGIIQNALVKYHAGSLDDTDKIKNGVRRYFLQKNGFIIDGEFDFENMKKSIENDTGVEYYKFTNIARCSLDELEGYIHTLSADEKSKIMDYIDKIEKNPSARLQILNNVPPFIRQNIHLFYKRSKRIYDLLSKEI